MEWVDLRDMKVSPGRDNKTSAAADLMTNLEMRIFGKNVMCWVMYLPMLNPKFKYIFYFELVLQEVVFLVGEDEEVHRLTSSLTWGTK